MTIQTEYIDLRPFVYESPMSRTKSGSLLKGAPTLIESIRRNRFRGRHARKCPAEQADCSAVGGDHGRKRQISQSCFRARRQLSTSKGVCRLASCQKWR